MCRRSWAHASSSSERGRLLTILLAPLVPCSARLAVIAFLAPAFFGPRAFMVSWGLVLFSMGVLIGVGWLFNKILFRGQRSAFIMEMPLYHLPNARTIGLLVWQRSVSFVTKAGTNILAMAVAVWALSVLPNGDVSTSYLMRLGKLVSPVGTWMGFDWRLTVALIASFPAKENAVAALGVLFGHASGCGTDPDPGDGLHTRLGAGVSGGHDAIPPVRGHCRDHAPGNRFVEMAGAQRRIAAGDLDRGGGPRVPDGTGGWTMNMLAQLVGKLEAGGTLDTAALSAELGASPALLEAMLEHLGRLGLIRPYTRPSEACGDCGFKVSCGSRLDGGVRLWETVVRTGTPVPPEAGDARRCACS